MNPCPTGDQLRRLLAEQLGDEERADVEAHVEGCPACQETLAELAGDAPDAPTRLPSTCRGAVRFFTTAAEIAAARLLGRNGSTRLLIRYHRPGVIRKRLRYMPRTPASAIFLGGSDRNRIARVFS